MIHSRQIQYRAFIDPGILYLLQFDGIFFSSKTTTSKFSVARRDYEVIHTTHQLIFEALAFKADLVHVSTYTLRSAHSFHVCFMCII